MHDEDCYVSQNSNFSHTIYLNFKNLKKKNEYTGKDTNLNIPLQEGKYKY